MNTDVSPDRGRPEYWLGAIVKMALVAGLVAGLPAAYHLNVIPWRETMIWTQWIIVLLLAMVFLRP